jgi:N utilization substance protein A
VTVPDYQLSLAIGKEGQNARLAARLTGWRIDIRSDAAAAEPAVGPAAEPVTGSAGVAAAGEGAAGEGAETASSSSS